MTEKEKQRRLQLEEKFDMGLWQHKDGYEFAYLLFGEWGGWATPETFLSY